MALQRFGWSAADWWARQGLNLRPLGPGWEDLGAVYVCGANAPGRPVLVATGGFAWSTVTSAASAPFIRTSVVVVVGVRPACAPAGGGACVDRLSFHWSQR